MKVKLTLLDISTDNGAKSSSGWIAYSACSLLGKHKVNSGPFSEKEHSQLAKVTKQCFLAKVITTKDIHTYSSQSDENNSCYEDTYTHYMK